MQPRSFCGVRLTHSVSICTLSMDYLLPYAAYDLRPKCIEVRVDELDLEMRGHVDMISPWRVKRNKLRLSVGCRGVSLHLPDMRTVQLELCVGKTEALRNENRQSDCYMCSIQVNKYVLGADSPPYM